MARKTKPPKQVETLTHAEAKRKNIPTAELSSAAERLEEIAPFEPVTYPRRHPLAEGETRDRDADLDPQIVWKGATLRLTPEQIKELSETGWLEIGDAQLTWRGKDQQDWSDLVVQAPPLYIQEKIHPKVIIEDLRRQSEKRAKDDAAEPDMFDLFGDFNGIDPEARTEFYQHDQNWQNRMILGDSLQVMASLAEREGLRGKVQCIYFDPPYGIRFNSNWQVSTRSRDVKDGKLDQITREPEQVKAFRDTWKDGIHSYLTYLRDRLTVMRDMLTESGSIFVQIGDENVHRVRALMDEVFGEENFVGEIVFKKTGGQRTNLIAGVCDYILWYAHAKKSIKYRQLLLSKKQGDDDGFQGYDRVDFGDGTEGRTTDARWQTHKAGRLFQATSLTSQNPGSRFPVSFLGKTWAPSGAQWWKTDLERFNRLINAGRIVPSGRTLRYKRYLEDYASYPITLFWEDTAGGVGADKTYVVQTSTKIVERCILMATDPGDLVLDPTCGSGTTAYVAEQQGRRWITTDTSRVSLALARSRLMGARYPYFLLIDSIEGRTKEQEVSGQMLPEVKTRGDIRQGFVYERAPHITLKSIANNAEIDVIWEAYQEKLEPLRQAMNAALKKTWEEWEIPREAGKDWPAAAKQAHAAWWEQRIKRQQEIDESIAKKADVELLYDRPYEDKSRVRVAGPFTVESLSPHRVVPADEVELIDEVDAAEGRRLRVGAPHQDFAAMVLENLQAAGVHQAAKEDRITFTAIEGWPSDGFIAAVGHFSPSPAPT